MQHTMGIKPESISNVATLLNIFLADEILVSTKTRNAHWNVEGSDFLEKHKLFEDQYEQLDEIIDAMAERIRTIGHYAPATIKLFLQLTRLSETMHQGNDSRGFIKELLSDHESIIFHIRENIDRIANEFHDQGTSDFITGIMERHEKMAWVLREHLK